MQSLKHYNINDKVLVNMRIGNKKEWRSGVVVNKTSGMLIVECIRTYFDVETETYYDELNQEGFVYPNEVKYQQ